MLNFEFERKITKEFLLEKYSEETYFEYYLGIPVSKRLVCSPIRQDRHPTCSFYRNKNGELIFKDFGANTNYSFINVVMEIFRLGYYQALNKIATDFGLLKSDVNYNKQSPIKIATKKFVKDEPTIIQIEKKDFSKEELDWWNQYGITKEILKEYNVYSCKHVFLNGRLRVKSTDTNFIFGYYFGKQNGRELWKIYMPMRDSYRFINNLDAKRIQGFKQIPDSGSLLVITKSQKDLMCFKRMGIPAIAANSEHLFPESKVMDNLKRRFTNIVVLYDNDKTGLHRMWEIRKQYPELNYIWIPKKYKAKDISDYCKMYGLNKTIDLVKSYILWLKQNKHEQKIE